VSTRASESTPAEPLQDARSAELYARAVALLPGGVNSPVRAMRAIGRDPLFVARGEGAELVDVDGNRYLDYVCSWGPLIHGHAHPQVVRAVQEAAAGGTSFGAPTPGEVEIAAEIVARVPSVEMVRMTSSGTEATMSALRLARAATGRDKLLKFAGAYHGHVDGLLADAGSGLATQGIPASPGVPEAAAAQTIVVPWNDERALVTATGAHELAAIIAEPYPANMGLVPPKPGFLELLRERADATGALLIFDEVISGFRVAPGGAQERSGVMPDLTIMGKVIGGGLPAAAYGGRRELMERIAPAGDVYQAGTLSGNPLAMAAGLKTLELLDATAYATLTRTTEALADGLREAIRAGGWFGRAHVVSVPGLLTVFFRRDRVKDYADAADCDRDAYGAWCRALLARGVYPPASQFEAWFPSLAHDEAAVERTVEAATQAFAAIKDGA
jgi:glutamate-1-semialdehyde 2,1-aminomutase